MLKKFRVKKTEKNVLKKFRVKETEKIVLKNNPRYVTLKFLLFWSKIFVFILLFLSQYFFTSKCLLFITPNFLHQNKKNFYTNF
mgnify:CR=1 FL=1